ncbi:MAG: hypothetical protein HN353_08930 [Bdellovibrionales bacterium]|jgi:hypothetical protein|nr:hypothetical protein [Bdellovibrionales bacterium]MBT3525701.1 hypothetical protein [Bdellovibrionales bacterium]MBT7670009.1 hypothetical protein [Bdellovibrionales bacterium]MBT7766632.1 hypothetical protein [Bdellovibrionales bacterium]
MKLLNYNLLLLVALLLQLGCSGITMLAPGEASSLYRDSFLASVNSAKNLYSRGHTDDALKQLTAIKEQGLLPTERSLRRNLIGVIHFSAGEYEKAIFNFDMALATSRLDDSLTGQIQLNLASSYYKLDLVDKAYSTLLLSDVKALRQQEAKQYYLLKYKLSGQLGREMEQLISLANYLSDLVDLDQIKQDPYFDTLTREFFKMDHREKSDFLEELIDPPSVVIGYLGYLEMEQLYYKGEKERAKDLLEWLMGKFPSHEKLRLLLQGFELKTKSISRMDPLAIGVVLPLSGKRSSFGKRSLDGIDSAFRRRFTLNQDETDPLKPASSKGKYQLHIRDSEGSAVAGAFRVKELIEKHAVSVVIGGLFSGEAEREYLEAKKFGAFFISLSQIYLPKEQKDYLLLEVPGSLESQINKLFSPELLERWGKRGAIIYPRSSRGRSYKDLFWNKSKLHEVEVNGVISYDKSQTDFRDPIKNILGLKFRRERKEEFDIFKEIHTLESRRSARRIQTLSPQIDFDWIFVPAFPNEAIQLLPSFSYYDAYGLNIVGGPSWLSNSLSRESSRLGPLFFIGNDSADQHQQNFAAFFTNIYKRKPRLIEMRSFDSFNIADFFLKNISSEEVVAREFLDRQIRAQQSLHGITGSWILDDNLWIKEMALMRLSRGRISKYTFPPPKLEQTEVSSGELQNQPTIDNNNPAVDMTEGTSGVTETM